MWFLKNGFINYALVSCVWAISFLLGEGGGEVNAQDATNNDTLYVTSGTTFFMGGNFTNNSGATTEDPGILQLAGNWTNNGTFIPGTGTVIFSGSTEQTLTKPGGATFYRLIINNSSSTGVVLNDSITVTDSLTLTDGIVFTSFANILLIANGARSTSGSSVSFVDGPMKKTGNQEFIFPIGDTATWARLAISAPSLATDEFTAEYFDGRHSDADNTDGSLNNASVVEYWTLTRDAGTSNVTVKLFWEDTARSGISDIVSGDLIVARYNGAAWTSEAQSAITSSDPGDVTSNAVSTFSPFTFGSLSGSVNPLPITLLDFTAGKEGQTVRVLWITATEINNDFFTVERSANAIDFEEITKVEGAGNSSAILKYSIVDENPLDGVSYYRLKQTDFDGSYEYSNIVVVSKTDFFEIISIFPNPSKDLINVIISSSIDEDVFLFVIDVLGNNVYQYKGMITSGQNFININTSNLANGEYIVNVVSESRQEKSLMIFVYN